MSVITVTVPPRDRPATVNAIAPTVRCDVLEALAGRIAQALHASRDQRVRRRLRRNSRALQGNAGTPDRAGPAAAARGDRIHLLEAVVAEDDVQLLVGIDQRPRHVVERDLEVVVHDGNRSRPRLEACPSDPPDQCSTLAKDRQRLDPSIAAIPVQSPDRRAIRRASSSVGRRYRGHQGVYRMPE